MTTELKAPCDEPPAAIVTLTQAAAPASVSCILCRTADMHGTHNRHCVGAAISRECPAGCPQGTQE